MPQILLAEWTRRHQPHSMNSAFKIREKRILLAYTEEL